MAYGAVGKKFHVNTAHLRLNKRFIRARARVHAPPRLARDISSRAKKENARAYPRGFQGSIAPHSLLELPARQTPSICLLEEPLFHARRMKVANESESERGWIRGKRSREREREREIS